MDSCADNGTEKMRAELKLNRKIQSETTDSFFRMHPNYVIPKNGIMDIKNSKFAGARKCDLPATNPRHAQISAI
jgi:hypothetical protein